MQTIDPVRVSEPTLAERHAAAGRYEDFGEGEILARQRRFESNARTYPRRLPIALRRARGLYVEDVEGRVFIDCLAGAGALALGHNHPVVVEAIERALRAELPMQTLDLATPIKDEFVQELFAALPDEWARRAKIQFCGPAGTDAVEAALKLVKLATGRSTVLAFHGAYHGMTHGALSLMGSLEPKRGLGGPLSGVQFLPFPYHYRCPFGVGGDAGDELGIAYIRNLLSDPEGGVPAPAALIVEPVQGEGGVIPASPAWLRAMREVTEHAEIPLIFDEIQTGLGRTGRLFAFEHAAVTPDVLVLSKAIGGGLPLSAIVYRDTLDKWQPGAHAGTFRGNQLAMAAGAATIRFVRTHALEQHAEAMGQRLMAHLRDIQRSFPLIGDVRGQGLMLGMEIVDSDDGRDALGRPASDRARSLAVQLACLRRGLIVELGGRNGSVVRFLPPLIVSEREIDVIAEIVADAVREAASARNGAPLGA